MVADMYDDGADKKAAAIVYWPRRLRRFMTGPPSSATFGGLRDSKQRNRRRLHLAIFDEAVEDVDPDLQIAQVRPLREVYRPNRWRELHSRW